MARRWRPRTGLPGARSLRMWLLRTRPLGAQSPGRPATTTDLDRLDDAPSGGAKSAAPIGDVEADAPSGVDEPDAPSGVDEPDAPTVGDEPDAPTVGDEPDAPSGGDESDADPE